VASRRSHRLIEDDKVRAGSDRPTGSGGDFGKALTTITQDMIAAADHQALLLMLLANRQGGK